MKEWLKKISIPKTLLGVGMIGAGIWLKQEYLVQMGLGVLGVGVASKLIKKAQGGDPFEHEKSILNKSNGGTQ